MKRKGFTLIELMVVVLIIGLLISILLPSLGQAMEAARQAQCAANLKGFGNTFKIYASQNNGSYPSLQQGKMFDGITDMAVANGVDTQGSLWLMIVAKMTAPEAVICPSDKGARAFSKNKDGTAAVADNPFPEVNTSGTEDTNGGKRCWSYSFQIPNGDKGSPSRENPDNTRFAIMADRAPYYEDLLLLQENDFPPGSPSLDPEVDFLNRAQSYLRSLPKTGDPNKPEYFNSPNHSGKGQNVLFQDGHVKWFDHPFCGIRDDNIYTWWIGDSDGQNVRDRIIGEQRGSVSSVVELPENDDDSVLVNVRFGIAEKDPTNN